MTAVQVKSYVVVPDGLEPTSKPELPLPSVPYRNSLQYARVRASEADGVIYLAPANRFGYQITEQEAAKRFLIDKGFPAHSMVCCPSLGHSYLDTRENALQLKEYLKMKGLWPLRDVCLIATAVHLIRASYCFKAVGFDIVEAVGTQYNPKTADLFVPRLWYYKYPLAHELYEKLALWRELFRGSDKGG